MSVLAVVSGVLGVQLEQGQHTWLDVCNKQSYDLMSSLIVVPGDLV